MNALSCELGDVCFLRCPLLPDQRDAILLGALDSDMTDSATTITCSTSGSYLGNEAFREDDYIVSGDEVMQITAEPPAGDESLTVSRAQVNTIAEAHSSGDLIYLLEQKWEVAGIKYDVPKAKIRLELLEMPRASYRVGVALSADATYDSEGYTGRAARSWAHPPTEIQAQVDPHTDYSYAR